MIKVTSNTIFVGVAYFITPILFIIYSKTYISIILQYYKINTYNFTINKSLYSIGFSLYNLLWVMTHGPF